MNKRNKNESSAIIWWKSLSSQDRTKLLSEHYPNEEWFVIESGTNSRIEAMWQKEHKQQIKK